MAPDREGPPFGEEPERREPSPGETDPWGFLRAGEGPEAAGPPADDEPAAGGDWPEEEGNEDWHPDAEGGGEEREAEGDDEQPESEEYVAQPEGEEEEHVEQPAEGWQPPPGEPAWEGAESEPQSDAEPEAEEAPEAVPEPEEPEPGKTPEEEPRPEEEPKPEDVPEPVGEQTDEWDLEAVLEAERDKEEGDTAAWEALEAEFREEMAPAPEAQEGEAPEPEVAAEGAEAPETEAPGEEGPPAEEGEPEEEGAPEEEPEPAAPVATAEPYIPDPNATPAEGGLPPGMFIPPGWEREFLEPGDGEGAMHMPWWRTLGARFAAASLVVIASFAAATSISVLNYLSDIASALGQHSGLTGVRNQLAGVSGGNPQTILLLGSDERKVDRKNGFPSRSDTTILLRLDPGEDAIALLSLPRDLKVRIPGHGTDKLNAAYSIGGPKLTLRTVKQVTGVNVNHLVNVNFNGFLQAVNSIDCVYADVDRRYYVPPGAGFAEINLQPGYQRLCGSDALSYVRYRHTDTDLVRGARQQDFLREARAQVGPARLLEDRKELTRIFTRYTTSDIDDPETMLQVIKLFVASRDAPIKEVHFEGKIGPSYVTATQAQIQSAVRKFLGIQASSGPRSSLAEQGAALKPKKRKKAKKKAKKGAAAAGLQASSLGRQLAQPLRNRFDFPLYYPTRIVPGAIMSQKPRPYYIRGPGELNADHYGAIKWVFRSGLGEYYGMMETSWKDAPILSHPSETRRINDRDYRLFFDGDRLRMVAWEDGGGAYWITNTLLQSLSERQMLGLATNAKKLGSGK
jgi:LCP family protein required for cell wall assembly